MQATMYVASCLVERPVTEKALAAGYPLANTHIFILDEGCNPLPIGATFSSYPHMRSCYPCRACSGSLLLAMLCLRAICTTSPEMSRVVPFDDGIDSQDLKARTLVTVVTDAPSSAILMLHWGPSQRKRHPRYYYTDGSVMLMVGPPHSLLDSTYPYCVLAAAREDFI